LSFPGDADERLYSAGDDPKLNANDHEQHRAKKRFNIHHGRSPILWFDYVNASALANLVAFSDFPQMTK
jgi:hypothetical protein